MDEAKTKSLRIIEARLAELEPGSPRYEVLSAARNFKAAWVELGEKLTEVLDRRLFEDWGYPTFEDYCQDELRIRKGTAYKLTRSFSFIKDQEPDLLNNPSIMKSIPQVEVCDLLRQAHESPNIDPSTYETLKEEAMHPDTTRASFLRQVRDIDPETFKPAKPPRPFQEERKALSMAKKLLQTVEELELSASASEGIQAVIVELEEKMTIQKAS